MNQAVKQLKYIVSGGAIIWWLDVGSEVRTLVSNGGWASLVTFGSLSIGTATVAIFLYLMVVLPRLKGVNPDFANWRTSPELGSLVPVLTASIVSGWSTLLFALSHWSTLNLWQSFVASVASYAFVFGVIGLIPVPYRRTL